MGQSAVLLMKKFDYNITQTDTCHFQLIKYWTDLHPDDFFHLEILYFRLKINLLKQQIAKDLAMCGLR